VLTGCTANDSLAEQYRSGNGQGYISGDGAYTVIAGVALPVAAATLNAIPVVVQAAAEMLPAICRCDGDTAVPIPTFVPSS